MTNIISLIQSFGFNGMANCKVHGIIREQLEKPRNIKESTIIDENGVFVSMYVFAVTLSKEYDQLLKEQGIFVKSRTYMVHGFLPLFVENTVKYGEWYSCSCKLRVGGSKNNYIVGFKYLKDDKNNWCISPYSLEGLDLDLFQHTEDIYFTWLNNSYNANDIKHPKEIVNSSQFTTKYSDEIEINLSKKQEQVPEEPITNNIKNIQGSTYFNKESRGSIKAPNKFYTELKENLIKADNGRKQYLDYLSKQYPIDEENQKYVNDLVDNIVKHYKKQPEQYCISGKTLIKRYISNHDFANKPYVGNTNCKNYILSIFEDDVANYIKDNTEPVLCDGYAWDLCKDCFGDSYKFYINMISIITGVSYSSLKYVYDICNRNGIDIVSLIVKNPYVIGTLINISYEDVEKLAICYNNLNNPELNLFRCFNIITDYIEDTENGSTAFLESYLINNISITLSKAKYDRMEKTGYLVSSNNGLMIKYFINKTNDFRYLKSRFIYNNLKRVYEEKIASSSMIVYLNEYVKAGLGVRLGKYISTYNLAFKECFVFEAMHTIGGRSRSYDSNVIDNYITEYEAIVGFKLEEKQREAVHLCVNDAFVVAGSAGSGKTTVSNCIVYVLKKLEPFVDIKFSAPTGKAAKRMQEVVGEEVKTLHSQFKIGLSDEQGIDLEGFADNVKITFFIDEGGMVTLDLMYNVLKKIDRNSCRVFIFGDFNQLPPIGKGLPFKNLLRFLPCVFLNVSKRAEENSYITYNSNLINDYSESSNWKDLVSSKDFFLIPTATDKISDVAYDICASYLGKSKTKPLLEIPDLSPDDIQVVTPITRNTYSWGTYSMNTKLQPLFNTTMGYDNTAILHGNYEGSKFKLVDGDRVIHVEKNMYNMQWYIRTGDCEFTKIYGNGICNGEVGHYLGYIQAEDCTILDEVEQKPDAFTYPELLRDDKSYCNTVGNYFLIVEYYDYISDRNIIILYRAEIDDKVNSNEGIAFKGEDLDKLNLFYAGTVHKLQGSQSKVVIALLDEVKMQSFLSRQLVYTMFTRAEKVVYAVGSVQNSPNSVLSKARRNMAALDITTIGEFLIDNI